MLKGLLDLYLNYLTFLQPVIRGAKLCNEVDPNPRQVANTLLALIFSVLMVLADRFFLSSLIATRTVYTFARIVLCLYFSHPKFLGALRIYERLFATLVENYTPMLDALVLQHIEAMREWGLVKYSTTIGVSFVRAGAEIMDIAQRLVASSSDTKIRPARLQRRLSQTLEDSEPENERAARLGTPPLRPVTPPPIPPRAPVTESTPAVPAPAPPAVPSTRAGQPSPLRHHTSRLPPPPPVRDFHTDAAVRSPRRHVPALPLEDVYDSTLDSASADALSNDDGDSSRHAAVRRNRSARESPSSRPGVKKFSRMSSYSSSFESVSEYHY